MDDLFTRFARAEILTVKEYLEIATQYRLKSRHNESIDAAMKGLHLLRTELAAPDANDINEKKKLYHQFYYELSICAYYTTYKSSGLNFCDEVLFDPLTDFSKFNSTCGNHSFYMEKLPIRKRFAVEYTNPELEKMYHATSPFLMTVSPQKEMQTSSSSSIKYKYNIRYVNYSITKDGAYVMTHADNIVRTRNILLDLDKDFSILKSRELILSKEAEAVLINSSSNIKGLEDVRLFGDNMFFCTCLETNLERTPQICLGIYTDDGTITKLIPLTVTDKIQCEKNWIPFLDTTSSSVKFIYSWDPFRVFTIPAEKIAGYNPADITGNPADITGNPADILGNPADILGGSPVRCEKVIDRVAGHGDIEIIHMGNVISTWSPHFFRGSSLPIPYRDGYLLTIHYVEYNIPRKYFHRFVWLSSTFDKMIIGKAFYFQQIGIEFNLSVTACPEGILVTNSDRDASAFINLVDYETINRNLGFL